MSGLNTPMVYALTGALLFVIGVTGMILSAHLLRKILAFNVMGSGAFMVLVGLGQRASGAGGDPVPQAMVLTGIVVAVAATALALALARHLLLLTGHMQLPERDPDA